MKKILLLLFCLMLFSGAFAQSFSLQATNGVAINAGATVQVLGSPSDLVIQARINLKNNATQAKNVKVKKVIHEGDTLPLTINYFCWGACFGPDTYDSPVTVILPGGGVSTDFFGDYNPQTVPGISRVSYVFYDANNRNDSVVVTVEFNASPTSVSDQLLSLVKFSDAYPNPAINVVKVDYSLPGSVNEAAIVITNMLGSRVKEVKLDDRSGKAQIPVSELINGIYFYSLVADDELILSKKFVVRR
jgi:hypothetical protein